MIFLGNTLHKELRSMDFPNLVKDDTFKKFGLVSMNERERLYVVTSFRCNCQCKYCLFRFDAKRIVDCSNEEIAGKVKLVLNSFPDTNFSISITGGEPLIDSKRVITILDAINEAERKSIRWIGFGSNGTTNVPYYLGDYSDFHFDLYLSRHHYSYINLRDIFNNKHVRPISDYYNLPKNISVKLSCNIIHGQIDSYSEVIKYLQWAKDNGISSVTFRELNKVSGEASMYNQKYILDYIKYYKRMLVTLDDILGSVEKDSNFRFISQDIRPFIYHEYWEWNGIAVKFRHIDEGQLLEHNRTFNGIDEVVIHPDGLVTGCWDRNQKVMKEVNGIYVL